MSRPLMVDDEIYRFRTVDALIGARQELARQEIYLALPEELNDPMEGRVNLVFAGDEIIWPNFLSHYVRSLVYATSWAALFSVGDFQGTSQIWMPGSHDLVSLKEHIESSASNLLKNDKVIAWIQLTSSGLASRNSSVSSDELVSLFQNFHEELLSEYEICAPGYFRAFRNTALNPSALAGTAKRTGLLSDILFSEERLKAVNSLMTNIWENEIINFPVSHFERLKGRIHRDWAAACFTTKKDSELMWTYYADGHRGACLIFDRPNLSLRNAGSNYVLHRLEEVRYVSEIPEIEFFSNIGRITGHEAKLLFTSPSGEISPIGRHIASDALRQPWVAELNEKAIVHAATKLRAYDHESEVRIVGWSPFELEVVEAKNRVLKYQSNSLRGIIFGERMPLSERSAIRDALLTKHLHSRMDWFRFWEEETNPSGTRIKFRQLDDEFQLMGST